MKKKTSFVRKKEADRRERVRRVMKARFAHGHRSTDTGMTVAGVGNTSSNTRPNSLNRRDAVGESVQAEHSYPRQELEVEAEVVVQTTGASHASHLGCPSAYVVDYHT